MTTLDSVTADLVRYYAHEERSDREARFNDWRIASELSVAIEAAKQDYRGDVCAFMHSVDTSDTSASEALRIAMQDLGNADAGLKELDVFKSALNEYCSELAWREVA